MDITIKPKFLVGNVVKLTYDDNFTGMVTTIGIYQDNVLKYWVEYVNKDGSAGGRWFDEVQLKSTQTSE